MRELHFERTVFAEKELAKLCPEHKIDRLLELISVDDFVNQVDNIIDIVIILNHAYERKAHFLDNSHEMNVVTREELENLSEEELVAISNQAFAHILEDGKTTIEVEQKKE